MTEMGAPPPGRSSAWAGRKRPVCFGRAIRLTRPSRSRHQRPQSNQRRRLAANSSVPIADARRYPRSIETQPNHRFPSAPTHAASTMKPREACFGAAPPAPPVSSGDLEMRRGRAGSSSGRAFALGQERLDLSDPRHRYRQGAGARRARRVRRPSIPVRRRGGRTTRCPRDSAGGARTRPRYGHARHAPDRRDQSKAADSARTIINGCD